MGKGTTKEISAPAKINKPGNAQIILPVNLVIRYSLARRLPGVLKLVLISIVNKTWLAKFSFLKATAARRNFQLHLTTGLSLSVLFDILNHRPTKSHQTKR